MMWRDSGSTCILHPVLHMSAQSINAREDRLGGNASRSEKLGVLTHVHCRVSSAVLPIEERLRTGDTPERIRLEGTGSEVVHESQTRENETGSSHQLASSRRRGVVPTSSSAESRRAGRTHSRMKKGFRLSTTESGCDR